MAKMRQMSPKSKYYMSREARVMVEAYIRRYLEWKNEYEACGGSMSFRYDGMPHGINTSDPTSKDGIRMTEIRAKMDKIEQAVHETDEELYQWLLTAMVYGYSFYDARAILKIPCSKGTFYSKRNEVLWRLDKLIV